ncbi:leucine-rich repeats and immunoglobulin-like domains protein 2 [Limulus polyphemus]|uniref:Leucine-rich repeats and immunoglobulin-like domains protein 2 n=1 Tax=Limulus polyphemus TaxID=6850 RepID=A0ABM1BZP4_LIMPO|nr:leucine-rich repeats and immunoglobulin-like domains protein 2 [Limulus polyphemus]
MNTQVAIVTCLILAAGWPVITQGLCPIRCQCNEERLVVVCDEAGLGVVPITLNPDLREFHLRKNNIKGIMAAFSVYHNLEYLDMTSNHLVALGRNNFKLQNKLRILILGHNMISSLHPSTFVGLHGLQILKLTRNFLRELPDNIFTELINLEILDLSENSIDTIYKNAFVGLKNLKILLLKDNKLGHIPTSSFRTIPHVLSIDLGSNNFPVLLDESFVNLVNLEKLKLNSCGIRQIHKSAFKRLNKLIYLFIQDNLLDSIPTEAFFNLKTLLELDIGQNNIKVIEPKSFSGLINIQTISISSGPYLEKIKHEAFSANIRLQHLVVNHNKNLKHIDTKAFSSLTMLRSVSLRNNDFQTFDEDLLPWNDLQHFDLRDNPLVCNCSLSWLLNHYQTRNFSENFSLEMTHVRCAHPLVLRDLTLKSLTVNDLGCHQIQTRRILTGTLIAIGVLILLTLISALWYRQRVANDFKIKCSITLPDTQYENCYRRDTYLREEISPEREWVVKIGRDPFPGRFV